MRQERRAVKEHRSGMVISFDGMDRRATGGARGATGTWMHRRFPLLYNGSLPQAVRRGASRTPPAAKSGGMHPEKSDTLPGKPGLPPAGVFRAGMLRRAETGGVLYGSGSAARVADRSMARNAHRRRLENVCPVRSGGLINNASFPKGARAARGHGGSLFRRGRGIAGGRLSGDQKMGSAALLTKFRSQSLPVS